MYVSGFSLNLPLGMRIPVDRHYSGCGYIVVQHRVFHQKPLLLTHSGVVELKWVEKAPSTKNETQLVGQQNVSC